MSYYEGEVKGEKEGRRNGGREREEERDGMFLLKLEMRTNTEKSMIQCRTNSYWLVSTV